MEIRDRKFILLAALTVFAVFLPFLGKTVEAADLDFNVIEGRWIRSDGGYTIRVRDVTSHGSADVGYFNPDKIHISETGVSHWKGLIKLFFKLQDKGYPGSTYTLYYHAEKDALAGFYYQAAIGQTFEVVFTRKPGH